MTTDDAWYNSFDALGEGGLFGREKTSRDLGVFGGGISHPPQIPSDSPLTGRFGLNPSYLRVDLFSGTINNVKRPFTEWHQVLKDLVPGEQLNFKQFKWVGGSGISGLDKPRDDDIGKGYEFPKTTLLWLLNKFILSEGNRSALKLIEFSGIFSPQIVGPLGDGDGDQSQIVQFIWSAKGLTHLKIAHEIVPPRYKDPGCAIESDTDSDTDNPILHVELHWHVPIVFGIRDKWLKHLELVLAHYDANSLGILLEAPETGKLQRLFLRLRPVHPTVMLGQFFHTMAVVALKNLTHLAVGLSSSLYNANGRLPRFVGPGGRDPEQQPRDLGIANDTYFAAYMFDRATDLKLFHLSFGDSESCHPFLDHCFGPDVRRFLVRQQFRPEEVVLEYEGVRIVGCEFRKFLLYLQAGVPSLVFELTIEAELITIRKNSAKVTFALSGAIDCSARHTWNHDCTACRSLYPTVVRKLAKLALDYDVSVQNSEPDSDSQPDARPNFTQIVTNFRIQDCRLNTLVRDLNKSPVRQDLCWECLPRLEVSWVTGLPVVVFRYRTTGRFLKVMFSTDRCEFAELCTNCSIVG